MVDSHDIRTVSDYEQIGGGPAVTAVVDRFYETVVADPQLTGYFDGVDLARLKRHQVLLVSQVLGGPAQYDGRDLATAHAGLGITDDDFARVVEHLVEALEGFEVPPDIIGRVGTALAGSKGDIVADQP
jgi:hemoglobin